MKLGKVRFILVLDEILHRVRKDIREKRERERKRREYLKKKNKKENRRISYELQA